MNRKQRVFLFIFSLFVIVFNIFPISAHAENEVPYPEAQEEAAEISFDDAVELTVNDTFEVSGDGSTVCCYRFTPAMTGIYRWNNQWREYNAEITLFDADYTVLKTNHTTDTNGNDQYGMTFEASLDADTTYYYSIRFLDIGRYRMRFQFDNQFSARADESTVSNVSFGESAVLKIAVSGNDLEGVTYQWHDGNYMLLENENKASLTTGAVQKNTQYRCTVTDKYGNSEWIYFYVQVENAFLATADGDTYIYVQPGESAVLKVNVTGNDLEEVTYRWFDGNDALLENENGASLTTGTIHKYTQYRCSVTDKYGNNAMVWFNVGVENGFRATANGTTNVYVQPGESTVLTVNVTGNDLEEVTYQWFDGNYTLLENENEASLTTGAINKYTQYRCIVADKYGNSEWIYFYVQVENAFLATADGGTYIYVQPGESAVLKVNVTGNDLEEVTYRWFDGNYTLLENENGESLTTGVVQKYTQYRCSVTDKYGNNAMVWFNVGVENGFRAVANGATNVYVQPGESTVLTVNVTGNDLEDVTYQWYEFLWNEDGNGKYGRDVILEGETGASLTTGPIHQYSEYLCRATDKYGNSVEVRYQVQVENTFRVTADGTTNVYVQPGESAVLTVNVTGNDLAGMTYRWYEFVQRQDSHGMHSEFVVLPDGTGPSLTTGAIQKYTQYRCMVTDKYGNSEEIWYQVQVENGFSATADGRQNIVVTPGESAELKVSVTANDLDGVTYQWYENVQYQVNGDRYGRPVAIDGETGDSLTTGAIQQYSEYQCRVTDKYGNSAEVRYQVRVENGFSATADGRQNIVVALGETAELKVSVTANDLDGVTYQWYEFVQYQDSYGTYREPVIIAGETGDSLTIGAIQQYSEYRCIVTDKYGNSAEIRYQVRVDNGFRATADGSQDIFVALGESAELKVSVTANDLEDVTYQWYEFVQYQENGNMYSRTVAIDGETGDNLTTGAILKRAEYHCSVTDKYGNNAMVWFNVGVENGFSAAADGSQNVVVGLGESTELKVSVTANDLDGVTYQWYEFVQYQDGGDRYSRTVAIEGENGDSLTTGAIQRYSEYVCRVTDRYGNSAEIRYQVRIENGFRATADGGQSILVALGESAELKVRVTANDLKGVTYRWYDEDFTLLENEEGDSLTTGAVQKYTQYRCIATDKYGNRAEIWFQVRVENGFSAAADGSQNILVALGESAELKVRVTANDLEGVTYQWYEDVQYQISYDMYVEPDLLEGETGDSLTTEAIQKYTRYYCNITDKYGSLETVWFNVGVENGFRATADGGQNILVAQGESAELKVSVTANDLEDVTYQWYEVLWNEDGDFRIGRDVVLPGETEASLTTGAILKSTEYRCSVKDKYGNSAEIRYQVRVENAFRVTADGTTNIYVQPGESVVLKVNVTGNDLEGVTYRWYEVIRYQDNIGWHGEAVLLEEKKEDQLLIESIQQYTEYRCLVTDKYGNSASTWFYVGIENRFQVSPNRSQSIFVALGETAELKVNVTANDFEGVTYQWYEYVQYQDSHGSYKKIAILDGETEASLTTGTIQQYSEYQCRVTDRYGNQQNVIFYVGVENEFQAVTDTKTTVHVSSGTSTTLRVQVTGLELDDVTYQWYELIPYQNGAIVSVAQAYPAATAYPAANVVYGNGTSPGYYAVITGETGNSILTKAILEDSYYRCVASDKFGNRIEFRFHVRIQNSPDTDLPIRFSLNLNGGSLNGYDLGQTVEDIWEVVEVDDAEWGLFYQRATISGEPDIQVPALVPTREGYTFVGWADESAATVSNYQPGDILETDEDTILYAVWIAPDLSLPASLQSIGAEAFSGSAFTYVKLPVTVQEIQYRAFADCPDLAYIYIPSATAYIHRYAFDNDKDLTIIGENGSTAAAFAKEYGFTFINVS